MEIAVKILMNIAVIALIWKLYKHAEYLFSNSQYDSLTEAQTTLKDYITEQLLINKKDSDMAYLFNNIEIQQEYGIISADAVYISTKGIFIINTVTAAGDVKYSKNDGLHQILDGNKTRIITPLSDEINSLHYISPLLEEIPNEHVYSCNIILGSNTIKSIMPDNIKQLSELRKYIDTKPDVIQNDKIPFIVGVMLSNKDPNTNTNTQKNTNRKSA